ncbi:MAG: hypothetical protein K2N51_13510 [Lachnospiraceae bacterium]|nr:hypothetical protein [Lachnospiraceae bacterium]
MSEYTNHIKSMSIIISIKNTVPAPGSIDIRVMPVTGAVQDALFKTITFLMSIRIRMGMDTDAVSGNGKTTGVNETGVTGRNNDNNGK